MATKKQLQESQVTLFLADLTHVNHSSQTRRIYTNDLAQLCAFHWGLIQRITTEVLRTFWKYAHLRPATRARKQANVARLLTWGKQQNQLDSNPMYKIERVKLDKPLPSDVEHNQIEHILEAIATKCLRDRLFFRLLLETKLQVCEEPLSLYVVGNLNLSLDNKHLIIAEKHDKRRTILLDDPHLVQQIQTYLKRIGYKQEPMFRAEKNERGEPLRYQSKLGMLGVTTTSKQR